MREENIYNILQERLRDLKRKHFALRNSKYRDSTQEDKVKDEIYRINKQLKDIDKALGTTYNNSSYNSSIGDYKPLLTLSLLLKVILCIALLLFVVSLIEPYLPDLKNVGDRPFFLPPMLY